MPLCSFGFVGSNQERLFDKAKQIYDQDQMPNNNIKKYKGTFEKNLANILADMIIAMEFSLNNLGMDVEYEGVAVKIKPRTYGWSSVLPYTD